LLSVAVTVRAVRIARATSGLFTAATTATTAWALSTAACAFWPAASTACTFGGAGT
jgi:hypothetical protein